MHVIRNAEAMAAVRQLVLDADLLSLLNPYVAVLDEFGDDLIVIIAIIETGDCLGEAERACGKRLVIDGRFAFELEAISREGAWFSAVGDISQDGSGLVLLVQVDAGTDAELIAACRSALLEAMP